MNIQELKQLEQLALYLKGESTNFLRYSLFAMAQLDKELKEVLEKIKEASEVQS